MKNRTEINNLVEKFENTNIDKCLHFYKTCPLSLLSFYVFIFPKAFHENVEHILFPQTVFVTYETATPNSFCGSFHSHFILPL